MGPKPIRWCPYEKEKFRYRLGHIQREGNEETQGEHHLKADAETGIMLPKPMNVWEGQNMEDITCEFWREYGPTNLISYSSLPNCETINSCCSKPPN